MTLKILGRLALVCALVLSFMYGVAVGRFELFPYEQILALRNKFRPNTTIIYKPKIDQFRVLSETADIVMVGDSITEGGLWGEWWPTKRIANRGVAGETVEEVLERIDTVTSTGASKALVMIGINDISRGYSTDRIMRSYMELISALKSAGTKPYILSTLECRCASRLQEVRSLNARLLAYATMNGIDFVDLNKLMSSSNGLKEELTHDGIHLTGAGYKLFAQAVSPIVSD